MLWPQEYFFTRKMRPVATTNKFLICLQYWSGDRAQALQLARLLADIEPTMSERADFLFVSRFDCTHDAATVAHVARKFKVFTHTSKRRGTGWPLGCNSLWFGTMEWFFRKIEARQVLPYKAAFCIEADGIPMSKTWIADLSNQWDVINKRKPVVMAGAWLANGPIPDCGHINGNAMITGDLKFLKHLVLRIQDVKGTVGWDYGLAPMFRDWGWSDMHLIRSVWRQPITEEIFLRNQREGTIWFHGIKEDNGIKLCRKFLLGQTV